MYYQLFEYSEKRRKRFPLSEPYILIYSQSEDILRKGIKQIKKVDPDIKSVCDIVNKQPDLKNFRCILFPCTHDDAIAYYKSYEE